MVIYTKVIKRSKLFATYYVSTKTGYWSTETTTESREYYDEKIRNNEFVELKLTKEDKRYCVAGQVKAEGFKPIPRKLWD